MKRWRSERGAVAVEFALVVPLLLVILLGIMEFGRIYNVQISLTHAARETARAMAIQPMLSTGNDPWVDAVSAGKAAAPSLEGSRMVFVEPIDCTVDPMVKITINYDYDSLTGVVEDLNIQGKAAMRCGG